MRDSVLVVDPDFGIRLLITTVLERAGFRTVGVDDLESTPVSEAAKFAVIVRDLNLAPTASRSSLKSLAATSPALLRRTVLMTTAPQHAATSIRNGTVFSIVGKPFDVENLAQIVRACARSAPAAGRATRKRERSLAAAPADSAADSPVDIHSLTRFVASVPSLQRQLAAPVRSRREASLRTEMRRSLVVLSSTLLEAAAAEASRTRAAVLRAASVVAARLASGAGDVTSPAAGGRDH